MSKKSNQKPMGLGKMAFKGNGVKYKEQGPTLVDNGVGPKKKTTKND